MSRVVLVTLDNFSEKMAGPAIRVWETARVLAAAGHDVRILTFAKAEREGAGFALEHTDVPHFDTQLGKPDVVVIQGFLVHTFPWLGERPFRLVVDLYDPFHLESLEVEKHNPLPERQAALAHAIDELSRQVRAGDFFLCASKAQRDLWIGQMAAAGRVNPLTYDADPTLRSLIALAPFGLAAAKPVQTRHAAKGTFPGIDTEDKLVIWGGGIYNWFDPLTAIRAVGRARETVPNIRLLFMGAKHPNPDVPEMKMATQARELVAELGLENHVFFNEDWVDYADRHNYLLDADLAVSAHFDDIETAFSFRTRILDYLWCSLPIVATEGDFFAGLIEEHGLGAVVPYEDAEAMAQAFVRLLGDDAEREATSARVADAAADFKWEATLAALVDYCAAPYPAADAELFAGSASSETADMSMLSALTPAQRLASLARRTVDSVRTHGMRETAGHARRFIQKKLA